jgi:hypothetical protein
MQRNFRSLLRNFRLVRQNHRAHIFSRKMQVAALTATIIPINPVVLIKRGLSFAEANRAAKRCEDLQRGFRVTLAGFCASPTGEVMRAPFPPKKDADFNSFVVNASTKISLAPTTYGLDTTRATALASAVSAWSAAYAVTLDPTTRTKSSISIKNDKRVALTDLIRTCNRFVQAANISDALKINIGFPVYAFPAPIPVPADAPVVTAEPSGPWQLSVKLRQADSTRRGWPSGVKTAHVYTYNGPLPLPTDVTGWTFQGSTSVPNVKVALNPAIPAGTTIYVTACWLNPRQLSSNLAAPVSTQVMGGVVAGMSGGATLVEPTEETKAA